MFIRKVLLYPYLAPFGYMFAGLLFAGFAVEYPLMLWLGCILMGALLFRIITIDEKLQKMKERLEYLDKFIEESNNNER